MFSKIFILVHLSECLVPEEFKQNKLFICKGLLNESKISGNGGSCMCCYTRALFLCLQESLRDLACILMFSCEFRTVVHSGVIILFLKTHRALQKGHLLYDGLRLQLRRGAVCPRLSAQPAMAQSARSGLGVQEPQGSHGSILQVLYLLVGDKNTMCKFGM